MKGNGTSFLMVDSIAYLPESGAAIQMAADPAYEPAVRPDDPLIKEDGQTNPFAPWGDDNLFPQTIIEAASKSTELPALLEWKARAAQGKEVLPFTRRWDMAKGKMVDEFVDDKEILDFLGSIQTKRYLREAYNDFFWFWNVFPDMIKSKDGEKIAYIGTHDASHCRWALQDNKGVIRKCWISPNWKQGNVTQANALITDVVDPYSYSVVDDLKAKKNIKRFVYPLCYPSPGKTYYQLATWDGFRTSGWMAIAEKIPVFKQAMMKNSMNIKYLIQIPSNYWGTAYEGWDDKTEEQKNDCKRQTLAAINASLTDVDNAGKSILNEVAYDPEGKMLPGWNIIVIDDKVKEGAYLEDSQEASAHLMRALGLDDTLIGKGPGKGGMGGGSGSDKRVALNIYCALQKPYRDVVLEPFYFIAEYNGWKERYPTLIFKTIEVELETLDQAHTTSVERAA